MTNFLSDLITQAERDHEAEQARRRVERLWLYQARVREANREKAVIAYSPVTHTIVEIMLIRPAADDSWQIKMTRTLNEWERLGYKRAVVYADYARLGKSGTTALMETWADALRDIEVSA